MTQMPAPLSIQINADNSASVRYDDGQLIGRDPGSDLSDLPAEMQATITAVWTPQVIAAWRHERALEAFPAQVDAQAAVVRARGHLFTSGPLSGKFVAVKEGTEDALNWLTLFTFAKDECDLGQGATTYPGPFTVADGSNISGMTWQNVLDAMRELRQFGMAVVASAISLKAQAASGGSLDATAGWPT